MALAAPTKPAAELPRTLTTRDAFLVGLGAIIGSGIFVSLGPAAAQAGPGLVFALLLAAVPAALNALAATTLGAALPKAGGTYHFGRELIGPWAGFMAGWAFLAAKLASGAVMASGFGLYLTGRSGLPAQYAALALVALVTVFDLRGPRVSKSVNAVLVAAKIAVLVLFIVLGFRYGTNGMDSGANAVNDAFLPHGWRGVWQAAGLLFSSYAGYARIATLSEEVINPPRALPRAAFGALGLSAGLYVLVALAALRLSGWQNLSHFAAPLAGVLRQNETTAWAAPVIGGGAVVASASAFLVLLTGISRVAFAMGRTGDLPAPLSRVSAGGVPTVAVLASGVVVALLAAFIPLPALLAVGSVCILFYYAVTNLAALRLPPETRRYPAVLCIFGLLFCLTLMAGLPLRQLLVSGGVLVLGAGVYFLKKRPIV